VFEYLGVELKSRVIGFPSLFVLLLGKYAVPRLL